MSAIFQTTFSCMEIVVFWLQFSSKLLYICIARPPEMSIVICGKYPHENTENIGNRYQRIDWRIV